MTPTVLIGGNGWLGGFLSRRFPLAVKVSARAVLDTGGSAVLSCMPKKGGVIINAAGCRTGDVALMGQLNVALPQTLARVADDARAHLVHLGSAAEYGTHQPDGWCDEEAVPEPESDYGRSKLMGTLAALETTSSTVLRVFNVASPHPQPGSPLSEIAKRLLSTPAGADVELLSAGTVRDWVLPSFICDSAVAAASDRISGVFNVASGQGVRMGDAVELALAARGFGGRVIDLDAVAPSVVIGRADRWQSASGLSDVVDSKRLATVLLASIDA